MAEKTCYNCGTPITKAYCEDYPDVCEHWSPKKLMTNGDRIRAMSDEELADFQAARIVAESCLRLKDQGYEPTEAQRSELHEKLYKTWLDWLKQPAEE